MFDKRLEINHQIHNLVADTFNTLVEKYDVSTDDRTNLHKVLAEVDRLVEYKDSMNLADPPAPVKPTSREIIKALMDKDNDKKVQCWVSEYDKNPSSKDVWVFIHRYNDKAEYPYVDTTLNGWKYATPFDIRTSEAITELPE